ncbi:phosphoenolpyruvate--protein phosphotransferase [Nesterenkonia lacusekhoensis]|uniref:Phosphoenolpyruvate-protein phosphotransferase n=1 Tax=Nesterenkonia lacusekhoensis TaxID=150832 RepID=A0ABS4SYF1_9MICC|nr:phosphoenolpyruvate--protein phosphotransferase [Nesterenkonia lacusekhoensis]MBP2317215.1 phosphotransferase system enzyme I (PtsI) [Nesterenkonia lacusekhoensis]
MTDLTGTGIGRGIARGPVARMAALPAPPQDVPSQLSPEEESQRVAEAVQAVAEELAARGEQAGGQAKDVLEAQAMMAQDPALADAVSERTQAGKTGEWAVFEAFDEFRRTMESLGGYLGERAADLNDVAQRVIARLRGLPAPGVPDPRHPFVLVAEDLAPADTALLDLEKVLALVTIEGGPTSHTAILAREKAITAVVGVAAAEELTGGEDVIVDAAAGTVITAPTQEQIDDAEQRIAQRAAVQAAPMAPGALADGTEVPLLANLGSPEGAAEAVELGAEGVGLFRTEFLFLSSDEAPTVAEQTESYTALLQAFGGRKVVVRALDAGADKPLSFLTNTEEENPALGLRGLRALLADEQVLDDQLTALAQAQEATEADLWVMAPMVSTVEEAQRFSELAHAKGLKTAGVMVEVPSSALLAEDILGEVDFASIGTNDLTQYTMAADRMLGSVSHLQDPWHPAVLRLIREVGAAGQSTGKPVGVCGEAAADPLLAVVLVGLGVNTLSMAPAALSDVRTELTLHSAEQARAVAQAALGASSAAEARKAALAASQA